MKLRKEFEQVQVIEEWGWKYHHMGIPTTEKFENERYVTHLKIYVSGFEISPYGIEWMRFEEDSPIHPLIQKVPHIAFEVEDLEAELQKRDFKILTPFTTPAEGIKVVMIEHNGCPIELIEFGDEVTGDG